MGAMVKNVHFKGRVRQYANEVHNQIYNYAELGAVELESSNGEIYTVMMIIPARMYQYIGASCNNGDEIQIWGNIHTGGKPYPVFMPYGLCYGDTFFHEVNSSITQTKSRNQLALYVFIPPALFIFASLTIDNGTYGNSAFAGIVGIIGIVSAVMSVFSLIMFIPWVLKALEAKTLAMPDLQTFKNMIKKDGSFKSFTAVTDKGFGNLNINDLNLAKLQ